MNSKWFLFFVKFLAVLFVTGSLGRAYAYRPFATEDAGVAGKGVAQLEVSADYLRWNNGDEEGNLLFLFSSTHGASDRAFLRSESIFFLNFL